MGLLDGVKGRFGFGQKDEWQGDGAYDEYDAYDEQAMDAYAYDDGYQGGADGYAAEQGADVVSFDAYNPDTFKNVSFDTSQEPQVAPIDNSRSGRSGRGYVSRIGTSSSRASSYESSRGRSLAPSEGATWATPSDPAFLDDIAPIPTSGRDVLDQIGATRVDAAADPYSQFDSDVRRMHRDPGARLEIVKPKVYSDVEKIATAAKAGKTVVLTLVGTKPELAKRILDFSFGVASALNKNVDKAAGKVFVISKGTDMLSADEREYLVKKGVLN